MLKENETPLPPVEGRPEEGEGEETVVVEEEVPLDTKLISPEPVVGQEFQTSITVDDIDPSMVSASNSASTASSIAAADTNAGGAHHQSPAGAAAGASLAGLFAPVMSFFQGSSAAAAISARLSDPPQSIRSMQPWSKFIGDKTKYSLPGISYIWPRVQSNFVLFKYNYLAIAILLLVLMA